MRPLYRNLVVFLLVTIILYLLGKYIVPFFIPLLIKGFAILLPFILAAFFSMLIEPIINLLHLRLRFNRTLSVTTAMLLIFGGIVLILSLLTTRLILELVHLAKALPAYQADLTVLGKQMMEKGIYYYQKGSSLGETSHLFDLIQNNLGPLTKALESGVSGTLNTLVNFATLIPGGITTVLTVTVVTLIATFFISRDREYLVRFWLKYAPQPFGARSLNVFAEILSAFSRYLRAQLILISFTMIQSIIGLYLIGAHYALTMGLIIGVFDFLPVFGPSSVLIPWIIWSFISGSTKFAIQLTVLWLVVLTVRQLLETKVVADSLGLHPLATLLAMYAGLKLLGVLGMILGPILIIGAQAVIKTRPVR